MSENNDKSKEPESLTGSAGVPPRMAARSNDDIEKRSAGVPPMRKPFDAGGVPPKKPQQPQPNKSSDDKKESK